MALVEDKENNKKRNIFGVIKDGVVSTLYYKILPLIKSCKLLFKKLYLI